MHLLIDLRFYRPEPYGLAVHIRDLFTELVPILSKSSRFSKITFVLDKQNSWQDLSQNLGWWDEVEHNSKFQIYFSSSRYYSVAEQTWFAWEILKLKPDLTFFFNFNFPILFPLPFVYQVLDLTIPKTKPKSIKMLAAKLIIQLGLRRAKHILFLGQQTRKDAELLSGLNFTQINLANYKSNTVLYNGINPRYLQELSASSNKSKLAGLTFSHQKLQHLNYLKTQIGICKEYFLFVSVWRKYKNIERLAEAFEIFNSQHKHQFQLVLAGKLDSKYPEILSNIKKTLSYSQGNILLPGSVADKDLIALQDGARAYVFPSLNEGFGLTLIEAAVRATPIICSDIAVFREILPNNSAWFFDPRDLQSIVQELNNFVKTPMTKVNLKIQSSLQNSKKYTWQKTAKQLSSILSAQL